MDHKDSVINNIIQILKKIPDLRTGSEMIEIMNHGVKDLEFWK